MGSRGAAPRVCGLRSRACLRACYQTSWCISRCNYRAECGKAAMGDPAVAALLDGSDAAVEKRWAAMADEDLDREIKAYRASVLGVNAQLQGLGVAVSLDDREPGGQAPADLPVCCRLLA